MNKLYQFVSAIAFLAVLGACTEGSPSTKENLSSSKEQAISSTVMITNLAGNSGGTGVVVSNSTTESEVLTNAHVCGLLKTNGGLVHAENGLVVSPSKYLISKTHDLCMVVVNANLGASTKIATTAPTVYSDSAAIGHPALMPTVVSRGHFSKRQIIQVMLGFQPCTAEDMSDDKIAGYCLFFGGIPLIKTFTAQLSSTTIMPGSSGSAVYNDKWELSGLVFAGQGELGYAYIVPYEYVAKFLGENIRGQNREAFTTIDYMMSFKKTSQPEKSIKDVIKKCEKSSVKEVEDVCKLLLDTNLIY